jgi:hypothetical protein
MTDNPITVTLEKGDCKVSIITDTFGSTHDVIETAMTALIRLLKQKK